MILPICTKKIFFFFGSNENLKICFRDQLTFIEIGFQTVLPLLTITKSFEIYENQNMYVCVGLSFKFSSTMKTIGSRY